MPVWAIADLHLSFGVPNKNMDIFGEQWVGYTDKIRHNWIANISPDDLILIPGDISWAMRPEEAKPDLDWIHSLPGTKVILRGNHDYWWTSLSKIEKIMPPSIHIIQNNAFQWHDIGIAGSRLWDSSEFSFNEYITFSENPKAKKISHEDSDKAEAEKIFQRELGRLELSLKALNKNAKFRIAMTHYPPISADLQNSQTAALLEKYNVNTCVFGHLHNVKQNIPMFGTKNNINYILTSCDYTNFMPIKLC